MTKSLGEKIAKFAKTLLFLEIFFFVTYLVISSAKISVVDYLRNYDILKQATTENMSIYLIIAITTEIITIVIIIRKQIQSTIFVKNDEYVTDSEELIEPYLLEPLIDHKVDPNDSILTCIADLIYKGNFENISNDIIVLKNIDNINDIEKNVLDILFSNDEPDKNSLKKFVGKSVNISSINKRIKKEKNYSEFAYNKFKNIQKLIKRQLIKDDIIDAKWDKILKIVKIIGKYFLYIVLLIYIIMEGFIFDTEYKEIIYDVFIAYLFLEFFSYGLHKFHIKLHMKTLVLLVINLIAFKSLEVEAFSMVVEYLPNKIMLYILFSIMELLLIVIFIITRKNIYTEKGKQELAKAKRFMNYINQYSLINKRDIDGVIVYDKYLVYAIAFGIPSNITKKIWGRSFLNS